MFESSHLVPNLNEMVEEYVEGEEEAAQETQSGALQNEKRQETEAGIEQPAEKTRKRKREAKAKQREERASDLVSEKAYFTWNDKL